MFHIPIETRGVIARARFFVSIRGSRLSSIRQLSAIPDASSDSVTGQYVENIVKPYTVATYARPNFVVARGKGLYLYDLEDREYVDFMAGIAVTCLGHSHNEIADIINKQTKTLMHCSNLYYNMPAGDLANKLITKTIDAGGMKSAQRVFLCNSGTEANEAALKFARKYGKSISEEKIEIISFLNGFHGRTMGALSVTASPKYQKPFAPLMSGVRTADASDINSVKNLISKEKTCAVIIEPIQGEGGVNSVDLEFLKQLKELCDESDAILIFDEIQCGLGRTGQLWAHCVLPQEAHPDIVTIAKALGNGFPIGAVMISEKVESVLSVGDHGTTYGGNPLGAAIGSYVVNQVSDADFLEQVQAKSKKLVQGLNKIAEENHEKVVGVKGRGLLLGLQLKSSVDASTVVDNCRSYGLLVITAGNNVVRILPALNIPEEAITKGLEILAQVVKEV